MTSVDSVSTRRQCPFCQPLSSDSGTGPDRKSNGLVPNRQFRSSLYLVEERTNPFTAQVSECAVVKSFGLEDP